MNENNTSNNKEVEINDITLMPKQKKDVVDMQMPELQKEQVVIETYKKKRRSFIPFLLVLFAISFIVILQNDKIMELIDKYILKNEPVIEEKKKIEKDYSNEYILINDSSSNIVVENINFYNFKKDGISTKLNFNYTSVHSIYEVNSKKIYIEFYDIEKNLLYKKLFDSTNTIYGGEVKSVFIDLDDYIYNNIYYVYVKKYSNEEINKESFLLCKYSINNDDFNLYYENKYTFKNDLLVSYNVSKEIDVINETNDSDKYIKDINNEYRYISDNNIDGIYNEKSLKYNVDLSSISHEFTPTYDAKNTSFVIKNKELLKEWECE